MAQLSQRTTAEALLFIHGRREKLTSRKAQDEALSEAITTKNLERDFDGIRTPHTVEKLRKQLTDAAKTYKQDKYNTADIWVKGYEILKEDYRGRVGLPTSKAKKAAPRTAETTAPAMQNAKQPLAAASSTKANAVLTKLILGRPASQKIPVRIPPIAPPIKANEANAIGKAPGTAKRAAENEGPGEGAEIVFLRETLRSEGRHASKKQKPADSIGQGLRPAIGDAHANHDKAPAHDSQHISAIPAGEDVAFLLGPAETAVAGLHSSEQEERAQGPSLAHADAGLTYNDIHKEMARLYHMVSSLVDDFCDDNDLKVNAISPFVQNPEAGLNTLYALIFGSDDWKGKMLELQNNSRPYSLRVHRTLCSLIGGAIHKAVFTRQCPWDVERDIACALGSNVTYFERAFGGTVPWAHGLKTARLMMVADKEFQEQEVDPHAEKVAKDMAVTLTPHLRLVRWTQQPEASGKHHATSTNGKWVDDLRTIVKSAYVLKSKMDAAKDRTFEYVWLKLGTAYDIKSAEAPFSADQPLEVMETMWPAIRANGMPLRGELKTVFVSRARVSVRNAEVAPAQLAGHKSVEA